jgi:hypothetical protein
MRTRQPGQRRPNRRQKRREKARRGFDGRPAFHHIGCFGRILFFLLLHSITKHRISDMELMKTDDKHTMRELLKFGPIRAAALALMLSACGGGGINSIAEPARPTFPWVIDAGIRGGPERTVWIDSKRVMFPAFNSRRDRTRYTQETLRQVIWHIDTNRIEIIATTTGPAPSGIPASSCSTRDGAFASPGAGSSASARRPTAA